jgi:hypothetical protein
VSPSTAPSVRLAYAAEIVATWPEQYAAPLAELLLAESRHAADLEKASAAIGWDRYPPGSTLVSLALAVIEDHEGGSA